MMKNTILALLPMMALSLSAVADTAKAPKRDLGYTV